MAVWPGRPRESAGAGPDCADCSSRAGKMGGRAGRQQFSEVLSKGRQQFSELLSEAPQQFSELLKKLNSRH